MSTSVLEFSQDQIEALGYEWDHLVEFKAVWKEHGGLVASAVMPGMLGISKQRWSVLRSKYMFKTFQYFDQAWHPLPEMKEFEVLQRPAGSSVANPTQIWADLKASATSK